jgi:hypothetical protein
VGLAIGNGDMIATGSETNELHVFYRHLTHPLLSYAFPSSKVRITDNFQIFMSISTSKISIMRLKRMVSLISFVQADMDDYNAAPFVSSVAWQQRDSARNLLVVGTSHGAVHVLELI